MAASDIRAILRRSLAAWHVHDISIVLWGSTLAEQPSVADIQDLPCDVVDVDVPAANRPGDGTRRRIVGHALFSDRCADPILCEPCRGAAARRCCVRVSRAIELAALQLDATDYRLVQASRPAASLSSIATPTSFAAVLRKACISCFRQSQHLQVLVARRPPGTHTRRFARRGSRSDDRYSLERPRPGHWREGRRVQASPPRATTGLFLTSHNRDAATRTHRRLSTISITGLRCVWRLSARTRRRRHSAEPCSGFR